MKGDITVSYVTDLNNYEGPINRVSPYHCYQYLYWTLRGKWRRILYEWVRREPCDASASLTPTEVLADQRVTMKLSVRIGETPLLQNGRVAVYFPMGFGGFRGKHNLTCFQGPDGQTGYGARITAHSSRRDAVLTIQVHSTGSIFMCVEVILDKGKLDKGDELVIVIGDPSCKPPIISERAKTLPLRVAIDHKGDGTFLPIKPSPVVRVNGGRARYLRCFAPATPKVNEPFSVRVIAADIANHNPDHYHRGHFVLTAAAGAIAKEITADMTVELHGTMTVNGLIVTDNEVTRIQVHDKDNGLMGLTNPVCPEMAPEGLSLYYGEIHSHTELSDGVGTPEDNYYWARDVEGFDFSALADHFEDSQSYNYTLDEKWRITKEVTDRFNDPGRFVTLLGYEIGTVERDRNVYFPDGEGRMIIEEKDHGILPMDTLFEKLDGIDHILIPHAPKFHGIKWDHPQDHRTQRLVEICSFWGISEEGGPMSVQHALDLGYKLGFTGGTDSHVAEPGNPDLGGITGAFASGLTRREIFEALIARRTFATSGPRMILNVFVNTAFMGEELTLSGDEPRRVRARAVAAEIIERMDIIRNGEIAYSQQGNGSSDVSLEWDDTDPLAAVTPERELTNERFLYYYMRVKTVCGSLGWASPIWVQRE